MSQDLERRGEKGCGGVVCKRKKNTVGGGESQDVRDVGQPTVSDNDRDSGTG